MVCTLLSPMIGKSVRRFVQQILLQPCEQDAISLCFQQHHEKVCLGIVLISMNGRSVVGLPQKTTQNSVLQIKNYTRSSWFHNAQNAQFHMSSRRRSCHMNQLSENQKELIFASYMIENQRKNPIWLLYLVAQLQLD